MAFTIFTSGTKAKSSEVNNNFNSITSESMYNYLNLSSITITPPRLNLSKFTSDDADTVYNMIYNPSNDNYETIDWSDSNLFAVEIVASSYSGSISTTTDDTRTIKMSSGVWRVYSIDSSYEVSKANVYKSLFYDLNISNFSTVTALKTLESNDVGKRAYKSIFSGSLNIASSEATRIDTFNDTTNNTNCQTWSYCSGTGIMNWQIPSGTTRNTVTDGTSDELNSDTSGDVVDNPANCESFADSNGTSRSFNVSAYIICYGSMSKGTTSTTDTTMTTDTLTDIKTTYSLPDFTKLTVSVDTSTLITKGVTLPATTSNGFVLFNSTLAGSATVQYSISLNNKTGFTNVDNETWTKITGTGTGFYIRAIITRTANTEDCSLDNYAGVAY